MQIDNSKYSIFSREEKPQRAALCRRCRAGTQSQAKRVQILLRSLKIVYYFVSKWGRKSVCNYYFLPLRKLVFRNVVRFFNFTYFSCVSRGALNPILFKFRLLFAGLSHWNFSFDLKEERLKGLNVKMKEEWRECGRRRRTRRWDDETTRREWYWLGGRQTVRQFVRNAISPSVLCEFSSPIQCQMSECWSRPCTGHVRSAHTKWDIEVKNGSLRDGGTQTNIPVNFSLSVGLGEKKN